MVWNSSQAKTAFNHVLDNVLKCGDNSPLKSSLLFDGINDIFILLTIDMETVSSLTYEDINNAGNRLNIPTGDKNLICGFRDYFIHWKNDNLPINDNWISITSAAFQSFYESPHCIKQFCDADVSSSNLAVLLTFPDPVFSLPTSSTISTNNKGHNHEIPKVCITSIEQYNFHADLFGGETNPIPKPDSILNHVLTNGEPKHVTTHGTDGFPTLHPPCLQHPSDPIHAFKLPDHHDASNLPDHNFIPIDISHSPDHNFTPTNNFQNFLVHGEPNQVTNCHYYADPTCIVQNVIPLFQVNPSSDTDCNINTDLFGMTDHITFSDTSIFKSSHILDQTTPLISDTTTDITSENPNITPFLIPSNDIQHPVSYQTPINSDNLNCRVADNILVGWKNGEIPTELSQVLSTSTTVRNVLRTKEDYFHKDQKHFKHIAKHKKHFQFLVNLNKLSFYHTSFVMPIWDNYKFKFKETFPSTFYLNNKLLCNEKTPPVLNINSFKPLSASAVDTDKSPQLPLQNELFQNAVISKSSITSIVNYGELSVLKSSETKVPSKQLNTFFVIKIPWYLTNPVAKKNFINGDDQHNPWSKYVLYNHEYTTLPLFKHQSFVTRFQTTYEIKFNISSHIPSGPSMISYQKTSTSDKNNFQHSFDQFHHAVTFHNMNWAYSQISTRLKAFSHIWTQLEESLAFHSNTLITLFDDITSTKRGVTKSTQV